MDMQSDPLLGMLKNMETICHATLMGFSYSLSGDDVDIISALQFLRQKRATEDTNTTVNKVADTISQLVLTSPQDQKSWKRQLLELCNLVSSIASKLEDLTGLDAASRAKVTGAEYEKEYKNLKSIISKLELQSKIDTEALIKFQVKCLEFDSVAEEREVLRDELQSAYQKLADTEAMLLHEDVVSEKIRTETSSKVSKNLFIPHNLRLFYVQQTILKEETITVARTDEIDSVEALKSQLQEALYSNTLLADKNKQLLSQLAELAAGRSFSSDECSAGPGVEIRSTVPLTTTTQSVENEEIIVLRETLHHLSERIAEDEAQKLALQDECLSIKNASAMMEQVLEEKSKDLWTLSQRNEALVRELADLQEGVVSPAEQIVQVQMNLQKSLADSAEAVMATQVSLAAVSAERDQLQEVKKSLEEELKLQNSAIAEERQRFQQEKLAWEEKGTNSLEDMAKKLRDESTLREKLELKLANLLQDSSPQSVGAATTGDSMTEKLFLPPSENSLEAPVVYLELGNFELRLGLWSRKDEQFKECFRCPAIIAEVKDRSAATREKLYDLVGGASKVLMQDFDDCNTASVNGSQSYMYELFRQTGIFVGADAHYCLFEHPDPMLRSALQLTPIISKDKRVHTEGLGHLLNHCFSRGLGIDNHGDADNSTTGGRGLDFQRIQLLFGYKACFDTAELSAFAQVFFEVLCLMKVCFVNEANLMTAYLRKSSHAIFSSPRSTGHAAVLVDNVPASMLIVDIGSTRTFVYPIFEGFAIRHLAKASEIGGESCSEVLRELLARQMARKYSSMPIRRQLSIARKLKEKYAFVAESSFEESQIQFGTLVLERKNVMNHNNDDDEPMSITTDSTATIRHVESFTSPDGGSFDLSMDRERFYCAEVLFRPDMLEASAMQLGLVELIVSTVAAIDNSVRKDICSCVLLTGRSSKLPGLPERLQNELIRSGRLQEHGLLSVECLEPRSQEIGMGEDSSSGSSWDSTATWLGADIRMRASLSAASSHSVSPSAVSEGVSSSGGGSSMFKEQEFILCSEYQEKGSSVVELLLDDCY
eukprot:gene25750-34331_t